MSVLIPVLIPNSSVPATKPECVPCPVAAYAVRAEQKHYGDLDAQLAARGHLNAALRLLADPTSLDRGALRDEVLAAKRSLL